MCVISTKVVKVKETVAQETCKAHQEVGLNGVNSNNIRGSKYILPTCGFRRLHRTTVSASVVHLQ